MASSESNLRRRGGKKEKKQDATTMDDVIEMFPTPQTSGAEEFPNFTNEMPKKKKKKLSSRTEVDDSDMPGLPVKKKEGIKTLPLILLILLTGTTLLPAMVFLGDYVQGFLKGNDLMGSMAFNLGIGQVPRKRVTSFYEKHAPEKVEDVPKILSKHYGEYPKLIKKLERKYQDYGYFLGWEDDEAPVRLLTDYLSDGYSIWIKIWNQNAPQFAKTAARNARYNLTNVWKKGRSVWKSKVWPALEPIFGVPSGGEQQKRKDAAEARRRQSSNSRSGTGRRRNREFRDEEEN